MFSRNIANLYQASCWIHSGRLFSVSDPKSDESRNDVTDDTGYAIWHDNVV